MNELYESLMPDLPKIEDATPNSFSSPGNNTELTPGQKKRMEKKDWNDNKLHLKQLALIDMFDERCEIIQLIIQNIANTFLYNKNLINKIECCRMYDQTYQKIDRETFATELRKFKSNKIFPQVKQIIQAEIKNINSENNVENIIQIAGPTTVPNLTGKDTDCCGDDGENYCKNNCYIAQRVSTQTKYFNANTSKCERRYGNFEHIGKYTKGLDRSGKPKEKTSTCTNQEQDHPKPDPNDILTPNELTTYKINIKSGGEKTPNPRSRSLSKSKTLTKNEKTLLKLVINYLLFICKMLTYHKYLIIRTSENDFKKLIKKPRKQKLYLDISNKLDELNGILEDVDKPTSKGGASYTRKKQRKKTRRKLRRKQCKKSRKKR